MVRGAWQATGLQRVGHNLAAKPPQLYFYFTNSLRV